jgi:hypothetical protein
MVLATLCGCGGDSDADADGDGDGGMGSDAPVAFPDGTTCGAALEVSGAVDLRIPPSNDSTACATSVSVDSDFTAGFLFVASELSHADIEVDDVTEGETGTSFTARLEITHDDGREWVGESCVADVDEHEYLGPGELGWRGYRVRGSIECEAMTSRDGSAAELEVHSFAFLATIHWS